VLDPKSQEQDKDPQNLIRFHLKQPYQKEEQPGVWKEILSQVYKKYKEKALRISNYLQFKRRSPYKILQPLCRRIKIVAM
jgi:hypothetical protein